MTMSDLTGRRILLVIPNYFGYDKYIKECLELHNCVVHIIYERNFEGIFYKLCKVFAQIKFLRGYYVRQIRKLKNDIDVVLVIRGYSLDSKVLEFMKNKFRNCRFIFYQWDSVANNLNALKIAQFFDKRLTFDKSDAEKYDWQYRPLFFIDSKNETKKYDIACVCLFHSRRMEMFRKLKEYAEKENLAVYCYLYMKPVAYLKRMVLGESLLKDISAYIKIRPLALSETNRVYAESKVVIDYTHPKQKGFTMRTIESLGNHCKLLTNNKEILRANFYSANNIYVYDLDSFDIPKDFIASPYENVLSKEAYDYYSLDGWLQTVLE